MHMVSSPLLYFKFLFLQRCSTSLYGARKKRRNEINFTIIKNENKKEIMNY
jgi:hypothetical protein